MKSKRQVALEYIAEQVVKSGLWHVSNEPGEKDGENNRIAILDIPEIDVSIWYPFFSDALPIIHSKLKAKKFDGVLLSTD